MRPYSLSYSTSLTVAVIAGILLSLFPHYAYSYCVYNKMEDGSEVNVRQISGQGANSNYFARFEHTQLRPGEHACCPYDNTDCSAQRDRNFIVSFWMHHNSKKFSSYGREIKCPAGGFIIFHGTMKSPRYGVFYDNGVPYTNYIGYRYVDLRKSRNMLEDTVKKGQVAKKKEKQYRQVISEHTTTATDDDEKKHAKDSFAIPADGGGKNNNNNEDVTTNHASEKQNKEHDDGGTIRQQDKEKMI